MPFAGEAADFSRSFKRFNHPEVGGEGRAVGFLIAPFG
jgi:hypothetical protein